MFTGLREFFAYLSAVSAYRHCYAAINLGMQDKVIGDQIEQEVDDDAEQLPRCLVLRMVPCCLPDAKMHSTIARRDCDMP